MESELMQEHMADVARILLGEPNKALSSKKELRYGNRGSLSIDLEKGTWFNHERGIGGGVADLIEVCTGAKNGGVRKWLEEHGFVQAQPSRPQKRIVATYDYRDEIGELLFQVVRYEPKDFRQRRPDGDGWDWRVKGVRQVPYRLEDIVNSHPDDPIWIVEGEKDADRLASLGLIATCNAGGAGKWPAELNRWFSDRIVRIIPDGDNPGRTHASAVETSLCGVAREARVCELPGGSKDVSEYLDGGGSISAIMPTRRQYGTLASDVVAEDIEWLWRGHFPLGMYTLVGGAGSTGKSTLMYEFAAKVSRGGHWPDGTQCARGRVAMLETEDHQSSIIVPRLAAMGADMSNVVLFGRRDDLPPWQELSPWLADEGIRLLVISPITSLMPEDGSTNSETDVRRSLDDVSAACKRAGCAFIGLGHVNKDQSKSAIFRILGSVAYVNASRAVYLVTNDKESGMRTLVPTEKFNIAEVPSGWNFEIEHVGPLAGSTRINWLGRSDASADDLMQQAAESKGGGKGAVEAAVEYLRVRLSDGPVESKRLVADSKTAGHSWRSLERAKKIAGVRAEKIANSWFWKMGAEI